MTNSCLFVVFLNDAKLAGRESLLSHLLLLPYSRYDAVTASQLSGYGPPE